MSDDNMSEQFQEQWLAKLPPRIRFTEDIRNRLPRAASTFRHIEFMMSMLESHPLIPFDQYTFGSDNLDFRRSLAYEVALRQLAHVRSATVNANIMNRPGVATAIRCSLELYAFVETLNKDGKLDDDRFVERLVAGRTFYKGSWYDFEKAWEEQGMDLAADKEFLKALLGNPTPGKSTGPIIESDKGFAYLYARYSEYVHQGFAEPRHEFDHELGNEHSTAWGSEPYYQKSRAGETPPVLIEQDLSALSFCLQMFWPRFLEIDPFFDAKTKVEVHARLKEQGMTGRE